MVLMIINAEHRYTRRNKSPEADRYTARGFRLSPLRYFHGLAPDCCLLEEFFADIVCCETCYEAAAIKKGLTKIVEPLIFLRAML